MFQSQCKVALHGRDLYQSHTRSPSRRSCNQPTPYQDPQNASKPSVLCRSSTVRRSCLWSIHSSQSPTDRRCPRLNACSLTPQDQFASGSDGSPHLEIHNFYSPFLLILPIFGSNSVRLPVVPKTHELDALIQHGRPSNQGAHY